jgi:hypothetical protein
MVRENRSSRQPERHHVHLTGLYFKDSSPLQSNYVLECNVLGAENGTLEALRVVNPKLLYSRSRQFMEVDSQLHTPVRFVRAEKATGIKPIKDWRKARTSAVRRGAQTAGAMSVW